MNEMMLDDGQTIHVNEQLPSQTENLTITDFSSDILYSEDEFYQQFKSIFQFASDRSGISAIAIKDHEERGARITAGRIYEIAQKYAFLRFMIEKQTSRLAETIMMIQFLAFKSSDIYAEKTKRKLGGDLWQKIKKAIKRRQLQTGNESDYSAQADPAKQQNAVN